MDYTKEVVLENKRKIKGAKSRHPRRENKLNSLSQNGFHPFWFFTHLSLSSKKQLFKSKMEILDFVKSWFESRANHDSNHKIAWFKSS